VVIFLKIKKSFWLSFFKKQGISCKILFFAKYFSQNAGNAPPKNQHLRMVSWPNIIRKEKEKLN
jgi:hypothetical protein